MSGASQYDTPIRLTQTVLVVSANPDVIAAARVHQAAREVAQREADAAIAQWVRAIDAEMCP